MSHLTLGEKCGKESLNVEYKEFCIQVQSNIFYNENDIKSMIETGVLEKGYNSLIYQSLEIYCANVFPKNIVSFLNANIDGELYLGIDDAGEITGIPFVGDFNEKTIRNMFYQNLSKYIVDYGSIHEYLNITIIPLHIDIRNGFLNNDVLDDLLYKYKSKKELNAFKKQKYEEDRREWIKKTAIYEKKINLLINTQPSRSELCEYINLHCKNSSTKASLMWFLMSSQEIKIEDYSRASDSSLFYWACRFKDEKLNDLLEARPEKPQTPIRIHPELIFNKIAPLRLKFLENNPDLHFYIIKVSIRRNHKNIPQYYKLPYNCESLYKIRRITRENEPFCSDF
tara:strand:- start:3130 stop:4149 length:1020 start_codon:yes stop_codon:yes gene_type:complete